MDKKYTRKDCIDALQRVDGVADNDMSQMVYRYHRTDSEPSVDTISARFFSWNHAKERAEV
jgi:hypothetical protein